MPAKSKAQQRAMGMAYAAKKGKIPKSKLKGASKSMYKGMSEDKLKDFAKTKHKGLPNKKAKKHTKSAAILLNYLGHNI